MKLIICFFLICSSALAEAKKIETFEGTFESIQSGDYTHLKLKGSDKKFMSFICDDLPKTQVSGIYCFDFQSNPSKFTGKKVRVAYHKEKNL